MKGCWGLADRVAEEFEFLLNEETDDARVALEELGGLPKVLACSRWAVPKASVT